MIVVGMVFDRGGVQKRLRIRDRGGPNANQQEADGRCQSAHKVRVRKVLSSTQKCSAPLALVSPYCTEDIEDVAASDESRRMDGFSEFLEADAFRFD